MSRHTTFNLRLFVAGDTQNSAEGLANSSAFIQTHLPNRHEIEVVDVLRGPKRATKDGVFRTPTLVRFAPSPVQEILGTLSETYTLSQVFGLGTLAA